MFRFDVHAEVCNSPLFLRHALSLPLYGWHCSSNISAKSSINCKSSDFHVLHCIDHENVKV